MTRITITTSIPWSWLNKLDGRDYSLIQRILDPVVIIFLSILFFSSTNFDLGNNNIALYSVILICVLLFLPNVGIYGSYRSRSLFVLARKITKGWLLVFMTVVLYTYTFYSSLQAFQSTTISWGLACWLWLLVNHTGIRKLIRYQRSQGSNIRSIVYWGEPQALCKFADNVESNKWMGLQIIAWFGPKPPENKLLNEKLPAYCGDHLDLQQWLSKNSVDKIIFSQSPNDNVNTSDLLKIFGNTSVPVIYAPEWASPSMHFSVDQVGTQTCIDIWGTRQRFSERQLKRAFDLIFACIALILFIPIFVFIAIAIKLSSPGAILYRQERYGLDGKSFWLHKFRSMYVLEKGDQPGLRQATKKDPRVTPIGSLLRHWSLDELPQLWNVICGEMSLVGPRPHAVDHNEFYRQKVIGYMQRHAFKPGITGLAQVNGLRGEILTIDAMEARIEADLLYQRNWSLWLDFKIVLRTLLRFSSPEAY